MRGAALLVALLVLPPTAGGDERRRPNVLLAITDDQSWMHTGANGDPAVATPAFDRVAREGVNFVHAFCAAPSCTPSRGALLTGQAMWRLREGGTLHGSLPADLPVYPRLLEDAGWFVGFTGKGWGPGDLGAGGRTERPEGARYAAHRLETPRPGMSRLDYAANFEAFLEDVPDGAPFCFWFGASEPHRGYEEGGAVRRGRSLEDARLPASLPDHPVVRSDVLDYLAEIERFDRDLATMLATLEERGLLDDTIVVVTSDHGMPFPRAKTTLYDEGTRVPLAIRWPAGASGGRTVEDFVSLTDLAPTFLGAAGVAVPGDMTGRSLLPVLRSEASGVVDATRDHVVIGIERHTVARSDARGYPSRALRERGFLYVRNLGPSRWPAGDPPPFEMTPGRVYGDIDGGPTKRLLLAEKDGAAARCFALSCARRPAEELYALADDPGQLVNVAGDARYAETLARLRARLSAALIETGDPRMAGELPWDAYPYHAGYLKTQKERGPR